MPARRSRARHDHDAGGDKALLDAKAALRERVWADLDQPGVARFPKPANRIPNFVGAEAAARRLAETAEWAGAATVKSNPDSPQWPVRQRALVDGKVVYMAVPRLAEADPFFLLDPARLVDNPRTASSIKGAARQRADRRHRCAGAGRPRGDRLRRGRLVGARLGKGGGFSDLELAVAAEARLVDRAHRRRHHRARATGAPRWRRTHVRSRHPRGHRGDARPRVALCAVLAVGVAESALGGSHRGEDRRHPATQPVARGWNLTTTHPSHAPTTRDRWVPVWSPRRGARARRVSARDRRRQGCRRAAPSCWPR